MSTTFSWHRGSRAVPMLLAALFLLVSAGDARADAVAYTTAFATDGGTDANGFLLGRPTSATSYFFPSSWLIPANDPEGTAEHELLHGIGFFAGYFDYSDHLFTAPGADLAALQALGGNGIRLFSSSTATLTGVLGVTATFPDNTPDRSHLADADFSGIVSSAPGLTYPNQACDLMTQAPRAACAKPYELSGIDKTILGVAFGWNVNTALAVNVNFVGAWTQSQKDLINAEVAEVVGALNQNGEPALFDWTVVITPEPGTFIVFGSGFAILFVRRVRRGR